MSASVRAVCLALVLSLVSAAVAVTVAGGPASANEFYNSIESASAANRTWMAGVADSTSLARLSVPGTHDSLALCGYSGDGGDFCDPVTTSITKTQEDHGYSAQTLTALDKYINLKDVWRSAARTRWAPTVSWRWAPT